MGGVALLVIGNSPATLLPFIVGTLEDGSNVPVFILYLFN